MNEPRQVFLFSGHMIDAPGRARPRFPPAREPEAARAVAAALGELGAGEADLGITEGACGGDLLFAEALLERGAALRIYLPFDEATFVRESVAFEKAPSPLPDRWAERFAAVKARPRVETSIMPEQPGPGVEGQSAFERCNLWMLETALAFGPPKLTLVCLWDGRSADGPGGTKHMVDEVRRRGGRVRRLETTKLWGA